MRLEVEGRPPIEGIGEARLRRVIACLRSYGPASFAVLDDGAGGYLQVAGGGVTCMMERRDARTQRQERAFRDRTSEVFVDGTRLVFGAGRIPLRADEWFTAEEVAAVFVRFLRSEPLPEEVRWRDISESLGLD